MRGARPSVSFGAGKPQSLKVNARPCATVATATSLAKVFPWGMAALLGWVQSPRGWSLFCARSSLAELPDLGPREALQSGRTPSAQPGPLPRCTCFLLCCGNGLQLATESPGHLLSHSQPE